MGVPTVVRAVTCDTAQYVNDADECTDCPANATCDGVNYTCADGLNDNGGICSTCLAGQYLTVEGCSGCPGSSYCPGDDAAYSCHALWTAAGKPIPDEYWAAGGTANVAPYYDNTKYTYVNDKTRPEGCICGFDEQFNKNNPAPDGVNANHRIWRGQCLLGPSVYEGIRGVECKTGYYGRIKGDGYILYKECVPCDNRPTENAKYTSYGTADPDGTRQVTDCPWECDAGYYLLFTTSTDGTDVATDANSVCRKTCLLNSGTLNISNNDNQISLRLFEERWTEPSLNVVVPGGGPICYADLEKEEPDAPVSGTIKLHIQNAQNSDYNGIYYATQPLRQMYCGPGYYRNNSGTCTGCYGDQYCTGDGVLRLCKTAIDDGLFPTVNNGIANGQPVPDAWYNTDGDVQDGPEDCGCYWTLSAPGVEQYYLLRGCRVGMPDPNNYNNRLLKYQWCSVGYYATKPANSNYWYHDCEPCTNGPEHSVYTSYSKPSFMYAVESNCPWKCEDGYVRDGDTCVAE